MRAPLHDTGYPPAGPQRDPAVPADELSLRDLAEPLWRRRYLIVAIGLVSGAVGFALAASRMPRYEAAAIVRVSESKAGDQAEPAPRPENFRPLFENRTIASALVAEFGLNSLPANRWESAGGPIPPDRFVKDILDVDQILGTNLMRVRIKLDQPELAAKVTNALVERAIALNRRINQQEVVDTRDYIKTQLDEATQKVELLRGRFVVLQQKSQVEALRKDAEGALDVRRRLLELLANIENERAFLARSEVDLAASQRLLTTRRSIDRDPLLMEAARERTPAGGGSILGLGLSEEQVNEAYASLEKQVSESRAKLAGLEGQRRLLVTEKQLDRATMPVLTRLYEGEVAVARLKAEYDMALKVYTDLSLRYEDARIRVGARGAQIQLVDPALTPSQRVPQRAGSTALLSALGAVLAASAIVLARWALTRWPLAQPA
jgi:uncharacterized protein involved in exopolysaccharide biosynthesis